MTAALSTRNASLHVHLPAFDGPLDLLLTLLQARRLDVSLVSLAAITREFVGRVRSLEETTTADIADFLLLGAQLVELKARLLLPNASVPPAYDESDSAEELLSRLQAYEQIKVMATYMADCLERGRTEYPALRSPARGATTTVPPALPGPDKLREIARSVLSGRRSTEAPSGAISRAWVSLETCMQTLVSKLTAHPKITFLDAVGQEDDADRVVGTFLAVLHLWKQGTIDVQQCQSYGEMFLTSMLEAPAESPSSAES